ncbi:unnamed protein product [Dracunculus medinensis]|uniref:Uncharacterized protein n=1 Tax=Dracunculus medinensis TaxID=318479 RepID=A0A0N4UHB5_DRAME|nr:unnamed protein product [Dracunculus medinensis]
MINELRQLFFYLRCIARSRWPATVIDNAEACAAVGFQDRSFSFTFTFLHCIHFPPECNVAFLDDKASLNNVSTCQHVAYRTTFEVATDLDLKTSSDTRLTPLLLKLIAFYSPSYGLPDFWNQRCDEQNRRKTRPIAQCSKGYTNHLTVIGT